MIKKNRDIVAAFLLVGLWHAQLLIFFNGLFSRVYFNKILSNENI